MLVRGVCRTTLARKHALVGALQIADCVARVCHALLDELAGTHHVLPMYKQSSGQRIRQSHSAGPAWVMAGALAELGDVIMPVPVWRVKNAR